MTTVRVCQLTDSECTRGCALVCSKQAPWLRVDVPGTNTPSPVNDLDARVAAAKFQRGCKEFQQETGRVPTTYDAWNNRAELQKPALHEPVTLPQRISELIEKHESLRATARVLEIDPGYLSRLASGEKCEPGATLLRRLGLRQITSYERI